MIANIVLATAGIVLTAAAVAWSMIASYKRSEPEFYLRQRSEADRKKREEILRGGQRFYCPEHKFTARDNSGCALCPICEMEGSR